MFELELEKWVGGLILSSFAAIISFLFATAKLVWHLSKVDSKIDSTHQMAVRAHKRIDKITNGEDEAEDA